MKTINNPKRKISVTNQRSYCDWTDGMQVVRKRYGEIAMTESELVKFFGVTWRKLNHRLQTIVKSSNLHPDERGADEEPVFISGQLKGCAHSTLFQSSSPCPFCWTARKRIYSESTSVEDCRNLHP